MQQGRRLAVITSPLAIAGAVVPGGTGSRDVPGVLTEPGKPFVCVPADPFPDSVRDVEHDAD